MPDDLIQMLLKAEACRRLADTYKDEPERKTLWIERANQWEELAIEAGKQLRTKT